MNKGNYRGNINPSHWQTPEKIATLSTPTPPTANPYPQPSQRSDNLPDSNGIWWQQSKRQPLPLAILNPLPTQASQRIDPLPVLYSWWEQFRYQPLPLAVLNPLPMQASQRWDTLPVCDQQWEQLPGFPPPPNQQRQDALPMLYSWWEQFRLMTPPSIAPITNPPPLRSISQYTYLLDELNWLWWEQFTRQPLVSGRLPSIIWLGTTNLSLIWGGLTNIALVWEGVTV